MGSPLSPKPSAALNIATPSTSLRDTTNGSTTYGSSGGDDEMEDIPSSPFVAIVSDSLQCENISPLKLSKSPLSPVEREPTSPMKMLKSRATITSISQSPTRIERSPRKLSSPEKRFPIKVCLSDDSKSPAKEHTSTMNNLLANDEGLQMAIEILEDDDTVLDFSQVNGRSNDTQSIEDDAGPDGFADETAFSTFSAIPDMTMFAKIGQTPRKIALPVPLTVQKPTSYDSINTLTPGRNHIQSSRRGNKSSDNTTNLILDFTEQFNILSGPGYDLSSHNKREIQSPAKSQTVPGLFSHTHNARTPSPTKQRQNAYSPSSRMSNLLDFDIPPAPTPRSMPSITPRELESLKSGFLSEISSLKASLSGKEAEVQSLKTAVGDAEKRVGECMEQVREERNLKEQLAVEKEGWEKRGREMEVVLRNVKEEIVHGERERDALEGRLDESEKRREAAEMMAQEAESKMAGMRAGSVSMSDSTSGDKKAQSGSTGSEVQVAVEKVARELHTLYRSKHETKVAALKKSYEGRWDKKIKDLEAMINDLSKENEELRVGRDATMSGVLPRISNSDLTEEFRLQAAEDAKTAKELEARVYGLSEEVKSVKHDNADLRRELEQERIEKGELVAACDELLALQESASVSHPAVTNGVENLRGSISRASGLRPPNSSNGSSLSMLSMESRIGKGERGRSGSAQSSRPGSGLGLRSGIMSSIEKMGSYKGREL